MAINHSNGELLTINQVAQVLGIHPNTIRKMDDTLHPLRYTDNHNCWRRYDPKIIYEMAGYYDDDDSDTNNVENKQVIIYARNSTSKMGDLLKAQVKKLLEYVKEKYNIDNPIIYKDLSSGLTTTRKSFTKLIDNILTHKYDNAIVVISTDDRVLRIGYSLFEQICNAHNITIDIAYPDDQIDDDISCDIKLLTDFIYAWTGRLYGRRAKNNKRKRIIGANALHRIGELYRMNYGIEKIVAILKSEGVTYEPPYHNEHISFNNIRNQFTLKQELTNNYKKTDKDTFYDFFKSRIRKVKNNRLITTAMFDAYNEYCISVNCLPVSKKIIGQRMKKMGIRQCKVNGYPHYIGLDIIP